MIRSILLVTVVLVSACANYKDVGTPGYPHCAWERTACTHSTQCCSEFCANGFCENREG